MYANQDVPELNDELHFQAMDTTRPESVISSFSTHEEKPEWHVPPGHCFLQAVAWLYSERIHIVSDGVNSIAPPAPATPEHNELWDTLFFNVP